MDEFFSIFKTGFLESLRNRAEIFWELIFPIILLIVFTSMSFETPPLRVYAENLKVPKGYSIVSDVKEADVVLKLSGDTIFVKILTKNRLKAFQVHSLVWKVKSEIERGDLRSGIVVDMRDVGRLRGFDYKFYVFTGVLTMIIFSVGLFVPVKVLSYYRERQILKLMKTTPVNGSVLIVAFIFSGISISIVGILIAMGLARLMGIDYSMKVFSFLRAFLSSLTLSTGIGIILGLSFKSFRGAQGMASLLYTFMPFFSGVYFPVEFLPKYLRMVSNFVPMKYAVEMIRNSLERL